MPCVHYKDGLTICRPPKAQRLHEATERIELGDWKNPEVKTFGPYLRPHQRARCYKCQRIREAQNLLAVFQQWYDPLIWCADDCRAWKRKRARLRRLQRIRQKNRPT